MRDRILIWSDDSEWNAADPKWHSLVDPDLALPIAPPLYHMPLAGHPAGPWSDRPPEGGGFEYRALLVTKDTPTRFVMAGAAREDWFRRPVTILPGKSETIVERVAHGEIALIPGDRRRFVEVDYERVKVLLRQSGYGDDSMWGGVPEEVGREFQDLRRVVARLRYEPSADMERRGWGAVQSASSRPPAETIAAYVADREAIGARWRDYCERSRLAAAGAIDGEPEPDPPADYGHSQYRADREACEARHFGPHDPCRGIALATPARLWRWLDDRIAIRRIAPALPGYGFGRPHPIWDDLVAAYGHLHRLAIPLAPVPPYQWMPESQALDALQWIANEIRAMEGGENATITPIGSESYATEIPLTPCQSDIMKVIKAGGKRLVTDHVITALSNAGRVHGESTVKLALSDLNSIHHLLTNCAKCRPRGYGLPGWPCSHKPSSVQSAI